MDTPPAVEAPWSPPQSPDYGTVLVDLDAFGLSRHSNHTVPFRQVNPGLGVTVGVVVGGAADGTDGIDWVTSFGTYLDSYDYRARYAMTGLRYVLGERRGFHGGMTIEVGYLDGSGSRGPSMIPVVQVGYDRVSVCLTGSYAKASGSSPSTQPDRYLIRTSVIAAFVEVELARF